MKPPDDKPAKAKVLLIDDEPRICAALAGALVSEGYDVVYVENGDEAIGKIRDGLFDIVLLDLRMPGKSGWETLAHLTWSRPLLPVVLITTLPDQYPKAITTRVGALLEKPLKIYLLLETMRKLLTEPIETRLARIAGKPPLPARSQVNSEA